MESVQQNKVNQNLLSLGLDSNSGWVTLTTLEGSYFLDCGKGMAHAFQSYKGNFISKPFDFKSQERIIVNSIDQCYWEEDYVNLAYNEYLYNKDWALDGKVYHTPKQQYLSNLR